MSCILQGREFEVTLAMVANFHFGSLAEIERDSSKRTFQSYGARYPAPYKQSNSTNPLYYSFDYGGKPTSLSTTPLTVALTRHHLSRGFTAYAPSHYRASILKEQPEMWQGQLSRSAVMTICLCIA